MYRFGANEFDRIKADVYFYYNMLILFDKHPVQWDWVRHERKEAAEKYYQIVKTFGKNYYNKRRSGQVEYD